MNQSAFFIVAHVDIENVKLTNTTCLDKYCLNRNSFVFGTDLTSNKLRNVILADLIHIT